MGLPLKVYAIYIITILTASGAAKFIQINWLVKTDAGIDEFTYKSTSRSWVRERIMPNDEIKRGPLPAKKDLKRVA
jgi:hypothetical protein